MLTKYANWSDRQCGARTYKERSKGKSTLTLRARSKMIFPLITWCVEACRLWSMAPNNGEFLLLPLSWSWRLVTALEDDRHYCSSTARSRTDFRDETSLTKILFQVFIFVNVAFPKWYQDGLQKRRRRRWNYYSMNWRRDDCKLQIIRKFRRHQLICKPIVSKIWAVSVIGTCCVGWDRCGYI